jgi:hypothetical protein
VFVGDEAFSLREDFMKPYDRKEFDDDMRIFNYRLSRVRRIIENVFGIIVARFGIFRTCINQQLDSTDHAVMACCVLHNFLHRTCPHSYTPLDCLGPHSYTPLDCLGPHSYTPLDCLDKDDAETGTVTSGLGADPTNITDLQWGHDRNAAEKAKVEREIFLTHFKNKGQVSWQRNCLQRVS